MCRMIMNIWKSKKPLFILAPMDDVTDTVFRRLILDLAKPDLLFTEFVSVDGLMSEGREALETKLRFYPQEAPLVVQIWGLDPNNYREISAELSQKGYAGIDINMGCPVKKVIKNGACSALAKNRKLAGEIIQATKEGIDGRVPVSVKCRLGFNEIDYEWIEFLLSQGIDNLTIHGRTTKEMSKVPTHWDAIGRCVEIRDRIAPNTTIIGNGDVLSRKQGQYSIDKYNLDGVMIARGIFQDPYLFAEESPWNKMSKEEKIAIYKKHIDMFAQEWGSKKNPAVLKKFVKVYVNGFDGASELRAEVMKQNDTDEITQCLDNWLQARA